MGCKLGKPSVQPISVLRTSETETTSPEAPPDGQTRANQKPPHSRRRLWIERAKRSHENTSDRQSNISTQNSQSSLGSNREKGARESCSTARRIFQRVNSQSAASDGMHSSIRYNSAQNITATVDDEDSDPGEDLEYKEDVDTDEDIAAVAEEANGDGDVCEGDTSSTHEEWECEPTDGR